MMRHHALDLGAQRVVEAIHRRGARLEHRVAEAADERHRGSPPGCYLRVEWSLLLLVVASSTSG